jgi:hypothetical protein
LIRGRRLNNAIIYPGLFKTSLNIVSLEKFFPSNSQNVFIDYLSLGETILKNIAPLISDEQIS